MLSGHPPFEGDDDFVLMHAILNESAEPLANQQRAGYLTVTGDHVQLTRKGVLQVDSLLTEYFEPDLRQVRYT